MLMVHVTSTVVDDELMGFVIVFVTPSGKIETLFDLFPERYAFLRGHIERPLVDCTKVPFKRKCKSTVIIFCLITRLVDLGRALLIR